MKIWKTWIVGITILLLFGGLFSAMVAAEGTGFDDAKVIGEGTYSGTVSTDYYYKVNVPAEKAILVTLSTGSDSSVDLTMYSSDRQDINYAYAENGASDTAFYDGKSTTSYVIYLKIENNNLLASSSYSIQVQFRPSDVPQSAISVSSGQQISGKLLAGTEVHWYKINVPEGEILNVSFSSNGGDIYVGLYDSQGNAIDFETGTSGYTNTKLLGNSGTIYIKVTSFEFDNREISYSITPKETKRTSDVQETGNAIATTCLAGIIIVIVVIVLLVVLVVRTRKNKKDSNSPQTKNP